jgi:hypothetical protein
MKKIILIAIALTGNIVFQNQKNKNITITEAERQNPFHFKDEQGTDTGSYPVVPGKYLTLLRSFADLALSEGRDTYGPQHSPVFVDGLSVSPPHSPAPWEIDSIYHAETGYPKLSYICNAISFSPFSRLLREITALSGEKKYETAAREAVEHILRNFTHPNGLAFWGSHSVWDCLNDQYTGLSGERNRSEKLFAPPMHEMKNPYLDYRFMHSVNPAAMETYMQQFWSASMAGVEGFWVNLDYTRHANFLSPKQEVFGRDAEGTVNRIVREYNPLPYATTRSKFYPVQLELLTSGFMYHLLTGNPKAWQAADALNHYHIRMRHPVTKIGVPRYAYIPGHWGLQNGVATQDLIEYGDQVGRYVSGVNLMLTMAELYPDEKRDYFLNQAEEELMVWADYKHLAGQSAFWNVVRLDGVRPNQDTHNYQGEGFPMFYIYARAYHLTGNPRFWNVARDIFKGYGLGDVGAENGDGEGLDFAGRYLVFQITNPRQKRYDGYIIHGLLELYRASGHRSLLEMACKIADDMIELLFRNNLPLFVPNARYSRLGEEWPLALADLEAAIQGQRLAPDAIHPRGNMILHMPHKELSSPAPSDPRVLDNLLYMQLEPSNVPAVGQHWTPKDVDFANPVYFTEFDDQADLSDWHLEGGYKISNTDGRLVLENQPGCAKSQTTAKHLVCWLKREIPADFLLEFTVCPQNREEGLNIVFFNTRGIGGHDIFDGSLAPRDGTFKQYHSGDLNGYHVSYWAGTRNSANLRKNKGFDLVATGPDLVANAPAGKFQTIRIYKRGGTIRVLVDDVISVTYEDDGVSNGPVIRQSGWIGLRQMAHTIRCQYGSFVVYPLR